MTRTEIGNINEAAERYGTDAAGIWAIVCGKQEITFRDGRTVLLVAEPERRQGTLWIVDEVEL